MYLGGKSSKKCGLVLKFKKKLPKAYNHPMGKNSPNPVTLFAIQQLLICRIV
jgi:hypothetical protein